MLKGLFSRPDWGHRAHLKDPTTAPLAQGCGQRERDWRNPQQETPLRSCKVRRAQPTDEVGQAAGHTGMGRSQHGSVQERPPGPLSTDDGFLWPPFISGDG